jgi:DNA repair exonuclease SbcCD ATPase subunit
MSMASGPTPPTWTQICTTRKALMLAAVDLAAIWAWVAATNWVGVATSVVAIAGVVVLGYLNLRSMVHAKQIEWQKAQEAANKESILAQLQEERAERKHDAEDAVEERKKLMEAVSEHAAQRKAILDQMAMMNASILKERESIHRQRNEVQNASLLQMEESNRLREQIAEMTGELTQTRRELTEARKQLAEVTHELEGMRATTARHALATRKVAVEVARQGEQIEQLAGLSADNIPVVKVPPPPPVGPAGPAAPEAPR